MFEKELNQVTDSVEALGKRFDALIDELQALQTQLSRIETLLANK